MAPPTLLAERAPQRRLDEFGESTPGGPEARPARPRPEALPGVWQVDDGFIVHPLIAPRTIRALPFQLDLARVGLDEDELVVLPTGLGKTVIVALVAAEVLRRGTGKVLFLAPTRPLVDQHASSFATWIPSAQRARFTGTVQHPVREGRWDAAEVVFATPQLVVNDLAERRYDLANIDLLIVDEAHHAVGRYAYVALAARYRQQRPVGGRLIGLTASPGGRGERIEEVVAALGVARVEARTRDDPGVAEYVQPVSIEHIWVDLPEEIRVIRAGLKAADRETARKLQKMGYLRKKPIDSLGVKDLIALRQEIFARPGPMVRKFGPLFHQLVLLHLHHSLERLETQGVEPFRRYVARVAEKEKPSRGDKAFVALPALVHAREAGEERRDDLSTASHPKLDALIALLEREFAVERGRPPRVLVFAQYRDTIQGILETIGARGWKVGRFVGQATREKGDVGMSQKEQADVLAQFRDGRFPILVASSVAEEGLDVPDVDVVVFFEAVPSEIRAIQRRGRTGRSSLGRVVVLLTRETRDAGYQLAEARRERSMMNVVRRLARDGRRRRLAADAPPGEAPTPTDG